MPLAALLDHPQLLFGRIKLRKQCLFGPQLLLGLVAFLCFLSLYLLVLCTHAALRDIFDTEIPLLISWMPVVVHRWLILLIR